MTLASPSGVVNLAPPVGIVILFISGHVIDLANPVDVVSSWRFYTYQRSHLVFEIEP